MKHAFSLPPLLLIMLMSLAFLTNCQNREMTAHLNQADSLLDHDNAQAAYDLLQPDSAFYASTSSGFRNRFMLTFFNAKDQLFIPLNDDSMMLEVEKFYTARMLNNEATLARYLVAACYRDMGLPTMAQQWASKAIEQADTTKADFNFILLYKAEMLLGYTYETHLSAHNPMEQYNQAAFHALKAKDSMRRNDARLAVASNYISNGKLDKGIALSKECLHYMQGNCKLRQSNSLFITYQNLCRAYYKKGLVDESEKYLNSMQSANPHINAGIVDGDLYKSYYANKINILKYRQEYDSAISLAKMEQASQYPIYKYEAAYRLSELYHEKGCEDSAYKYLAIYNDYMDSALVRKQEAILQKYQHQTDIMNVRAQIKSYNEENRQRRVLFAIVVICSFVICMVIKRQKHKKYEIVTQELKDRSTKLEKLENYCKNLEKESQEYKANIAQLKKDLLFARGEIKGITPPSASEMLFKERLAAIMQTETMKQWQKIIQQGSEPTKAIYDQMLEEVRVIAPDTYDLLCNKAYIKDNNTLRLCLLIIFQTKNKLISSFFKWTPQLVSNSKSRLNECIFNQKSALCFIENLLTYKK